MSRKKKKSFVFIAILLNAAVSFAVVVALFLIFGFSYANEQRVYNLQRVNDYIENSIYSVDVYCESVINTASRIAYDETIINSLVSGTAITNPSVKESVRNTIDYYVGANLNIEAVALTTPEGESIQSTVLVVSQYDINQIIYQKMSDSHIDLINVGDKLFVLVRIYDVKAEQDTHIGNVIAQLSKINLETILSATFFTENTGIALLYKDEPILVINESKGDKAQSYIGDCYNNLTLNVQIPDSDLTPSFITSLSTILPIVLLIAILLLAASIIINYSITKPVRLLSDACAEIPAVRNRIPSVRSYGELNVIAEKINVIIDDINHLAEEALIAEQEIHASQLDLKQLKMDMLYSQINSHFLYNTLSNIRGMALKGGNEEVADTLHLLVKYFRYCSGLEIYSTVEQEIESLNIYLKILKIRLGEFIQFSIIYSNDILHYNILHILLQPLAENAIVHGFDNRITPAKIEFIFTKKDDYLEITVKDNGKGFDNKVLQRINDITDTAPLSFSNHNSGIGLQNIKKRLSLYYDNYQIFAKNDSGAVVTIILPVKENNV